MNTAETRPRTPERVLLVEDSTTQALRMQIVLESHGFTVQVCPTGAMALALASEREPDLVLLDMHLPDMGGREVARRLKQDPYLSGIPVIFITEIFRDVADVVTGFDQGVDDYLIKPVDDGELVARIRATLRARKTQRELGRLARVLMTVNQVGMQLTGILHLETLLPSVARLICEAFDYPGVRLYLTRDGAQHLAASEGEVPVSAQCMSVPFHAGGRVAGALEIAVADSGGLSELDQVTLQTLGEMVGIAVGNARLYQEMEDLARLDALTGLLNRRAILARLADEFTRACRYRRHLTIMMIDLDKFKAINDDHGHSMGDEVLQAVAAQLQQSVRTVDVVGRLGGDEFLILLPETDAGSAWVVAERVWRDIAALQVGPVSPRVSLGLAEVPLELPGAQGDLLRRADAAMYRAKGCSGPAVQVAP